MSQDNTANKWGYRYSRFISKHMALLTSSQYVMMPWSLCPCIATVQFLNTVIKNQTDYSEMVS